MVNTTNAHYRSLIHYNFWKSTSFVIKVNSGAARRFTIPTHWSGGYNYDLKTSDGQSFTGLTGNISIDFPANTDYILEISGDFPWWWQNNSGEAVRVLDIIQWGNIEWSSFEASFFGCENLTVSATDKPDLSNVTHMGMMFYKTQFNSDISDWDVSNVTNIEFTFAYTPFNQDISGWDVSNVIWMNGIFLDSQFNQDISGWDVSNVTHMNKIFQDTPFNQDISGWNVSNVTRMSEMFRDSSFNQNISGWNVNNVIEWNEFRTGSPLTTPNTPPKFL